MSSDQTHDSMPSGALPTPHHVLVALRRRASELRQTAGRIDKDDVDHAVAKAVADAAAREAALLARPPADDDPQSERVKAIMARMHAAVARFRAGDDDPATREMVERLPAAWRIAAIRHDEMLRARLETLPRRPITIDDYVECWWVPGETHIVDLIHPETGLTLHYAHGPDQVTARHPGVVRIDCEEAWRAIEQVERTRYVRGVEEITEDTFMDALNVLPPVGWTTRGGVESFKISERITGTLTDIFARLGDRYFKLTDDIRLPADVIAARVAAFVSAHPSPQRGGIEGPGSSSGISRPAPGEVT